MADSTQAPALHASQAQLDLAEAAVKQANEAQRGDALCTLAWYLRDRAPRRAAALAAQGLTLPVSAPAAVHARLALAHAFTLLEDNQAAAAALARAEQGAAGESDAGLLGDVHITGAVMARLRRDRAVEAPHLARAHAAYLQAGQAHRLQLTEAMMAWSQAYRGEAPDPRWLQVFPPGHVPEQRDVAAYALSYHGARAFVGGEPAQATQMYRAGAAAAGDCGLRSLQIANYGLMATSSGMLGNPAGSLEYVEMALDLLHGAGHVAEKATLQIYHAQSLIELNQFDLARRLLDESMEAGLRLPEDKRYVTYCNTCAWLERKCGNWRAVLEWADRALASHQRWIRGANMLMWRALAQAHLGDIEAAMVSINDTLTATALAKEPYFETFLRTELGTLHRDLDLPRPPGQSRLDAQFEQYDQAHRIARGINSALVDPALLTELIRVHEARGELALALERAKERHDVIEIRRSQAAADREVAQAMRERLLHATADAEHHRDVAGLLERLGDIGRRLNAEHDPQRVIAALVDNANALLACDSIAVFRLDASTGRLVLALGLELGQPIAIPDIALDDEHSVCARVVREHIDVRVENDDTLGESPATAPGTRAMRSRLYASLSVAGTVLGALTLQAERPRAYGERELLAVRALAAYGAVALANADNAHRLRLASEAKSMFLASMSHELRTPLNGILGFSQLLGFDPALNDKQRGKLRIIHDCGEHLLALINDILDLSRIEAGHFELIKQDVSMQELLALVADIARVKADEKNLLFKLDTAADLPARVEVDDTRLRQVLINLLGNAVKFTDAGSVRLVVTSRPALAGRATLGFEVHDSGVGIAAEQLETIFAPFEQVGDSQRRRAGTGLGLAISRQLVRLMGGNIWVRSTLGQGSVFGFDIEVAATLSTPAVIAPHAARIVGYAGARRSVLVVDDTESARTLFSGFLDVMGFEVREAENGLEALHLAQARAPDLILMDHTMPIMGGVEATQRLRGLPGMAAVPVVSISATGAESAADEPAASRADIYLRKPVDLDMLARTIGELLQLQWVHAQP